MLREIEESAPAPEKPQRIDDGQISLTSFAGEDIINDLKSLDPNVLTPIEALQKIYELTKKAKEC